ncbi:MAG: PilZ domain-containing protein [Deltaproteobacteria bacterium]|nr:PilZ domain-containing protein [Deltaproteobacteria bacterium]
MEVSEGQENNRQTDRMSFGSNLLIQNGCSTPAQGVDISSGGLGIEIERPLYVGERVELVFFKNTFKVDGTVRYCRESTAFGVCRYRVGLQIHMVFQALVDLLLMLDMEYKPA